MSGKFREAKLKKGKMGLWEITAESCPLRKAAEMLEQKQPCCGAGVMTNIQGAVVLSQCKFSTEKKKIFIWCNKEDSE